MTETKNSSGAKKVKREVCDTKVKREPCDAKVKTEPCDTKVKSEPRDHPVKQEFHVKGEPGKKIKSEKRRCSSSPCSYVPTPCCSKAKREARYQALMNKSVAKLDAKLKHMLGARASKEKKQDIKRQQRFGIRLGKGGCKETEWLVPPNLMSAQVVSLSDKRSRVAENPHAWQRAGALDEAGRLQVAIQSKQSGVVGVWYHPNDQAWVAKWHEGKKHVQKYFKIASYHKDGRNRPQAEAKALKEAIKYRQKKVNNGECKVINQHGRRACRVSGVRGVTWHSVQKCWTVRTVVRGRTHRRRVKPTDDSEDSIERARLIAIMARKKCEKKLFNICKRVGRDRLM